MSHDSDRRTHADALRRHNRTNQTARFKRQAGIMLGSIALGAIILPYAIFDKEILQAAATYHVARAKSWFAEGTAAKPTMIIRIDGIDYAAPTDAVIAQPYYRDRADAVFAKFKIGAVLGFAGWLAGLFLLRGVAARRREAALRDRVIAGTLVTSEAQIARLTGSEADARALHIGTVPLPNRLETRHMAMIGTTGSGKTTVLRQMLDGIESRGEAALVYDTSGEFVAHYYRPERGDIILNPFDARCAIWSPFDEIAHPADADRIAHQLITETGQNDRDVWLETSRILVANMLRALWHEGKCTLEDLLNALQSRTKDDLKLWLGNSSSARTFAEDADRATGSVLFMLAKAANLIQFLSVKGHDNPFAFRDFIHGLDQRSGPRPWIFVPRKEDYFEASKPLLACWLECAASAVLGLPPSPNRRIWFILDELADLPRVENMARLLPEGRKFGAAVILTFQALGQMRHRYGPQIAESMLGCCNTKLFLQTIDSETRLAIVNAAEAKAAAPDHKTAMAMHGDMTADRAIAHASEKLGERQSVFSANELQEEAGRFGLGKVSYTQIAQAVDNAAKQGDLLPRSYVDRRGAEFAGFTTRDNVETETKLLRIEAAGRGRSPPIASRMDAAKAVASATADAKRSGFDWNADQRTATAQLLTSRNRITALQGYAGTAKTTTVLATLAREAEARGVQVTALAPTASAAMVLSEALGTRGDTVARHLLSPERIGGSNSAVWIVDEASLLSARDTAKLFEQAEKQNARVILVGDVKQLGSVEAGAAFAHLQGAGMETAKLDKIVRQTNSATKEAVLASIAGDARKALAALDRGGGRIIENPDRADRFAAIAKDYATLNRATRSKTLVIEPSREGRDALTADIRAALAKSGALTGPGTTMKSLVAKSLTRAEARLPESYDKGDIVRFTRDYADKGVSRGATYRVEGVDPVKAAVALKAADGREIDWRLRQWGAGKVQAFSPQSLELKTGDRIQFTRNDREAGRINGGRAEVTAINEQARIATIRSPRGQTQTLGLDNPRDQHIRHAYVETAFAAQGRTADHIIIHADSRATNLVDQKSFYVGVSRAKASVAIYTNDRAKLVSAISERAGVTQTAITQSMVPVPKAVKVMGAGLG